MNIDWSQVESDDYRKYVAKQRAIGCPEETIRDIIVADVNKLFEARGQALAGLPAGKFEFWKRAQPRGVNEEKVKQQIELAKEKRAVLKELLGVEVEDKTPLMPPSNERETRLSFLSKDKQQQLSELDATYNAKVRSLMAGKLRPNKEDMENFRKLEAEKRAAVAQILTPQELEDYELNTSRTAEFMRMTLGDFQMSEQEFREVFKLRKQFEDQIGFSFGPDPDDPKRMAARLELDKQIRDIMGDQRYTEFTREQSWSTSSLQNVAKQYGVPKETAVQVFDLKPFVEEQATKLRLDSSLPVEQRQQALKMVQAETLKAIGEIIGAEAAQAYYREGMWIRNLARE